MLATKTTSIHSQDSVQGALPPKYHPETVPAPTLPSLKSYNDQRDTFQIALVPSQVYESMEIKPPPFNFDCSMSNVLSTTYQPVHAVPRATSSLPPISTLKLASMVPLEGYRSIMPSALISQASSQSPHHFHDLHGTNFRPMSVQSEPSSPQDSQVSNSQPARKNSLTGKRMVKCRRQNCVNYARRKRLCVEHGGRHFCKADGCQKCAHRGGFCISHGGGRRCTVKNCTKSAQTGGVCYGHGGGKRCGYWECTQAARSGGYCIRHRKQLERLNQV